MNRMKNGLVVSCQAHFDHPLNDPATIAALARSAELGGAVGIRANGVEHIREIKKHVKVPVIGIYKVHQHDQRFFITPTFEHAKAIVEAGTDIVALEATFQNHPDTDVLKRLIQDIKVKLNRPVMADVSTFEEGVRAWELGADLVGTTLSGYTEQSMNRPLPDLDLVGKLADAGITTVCEGHVASPEQAQEAIRAGAYFVVVGTAITDTTFITKRYAEPMARLDSESENHVRGVR
jgi:N-acylglucosamine-6-phosphate 2-epimerase